MKYQLLAVTIAAIALYGCAPPPAPTPPICPAFAPPPVAVFVPPTPTIPPPASVVHRHVAHGGHPAVIAHRRAHRYDALRATYAAAEPPGCGSAEHPCDVIHLTAPIQ